MKKKDLKEMVKQEIESEASALERRVNTKKSLASLEMPEDSYEDLMERIREKKEQELETESVSKSPVKIIPFHTRRRKALATAAMIAVLVVGAGVGVQGARLYFLNVENRERNGRTDVVASTEDVFYIDLTEEEVYEKIEEKIGILALRLTDKPKGMELKTVYIDEEMGEAIMEFHYNDHVLTIYENKQNDNASFNMQSDGEIIETIENFYLEKNLKIIEVDKSDGNIAYQAQIEYGNAFYLLSADIKLKEFETILYGMIFGSN